MVKVITPADMATEGIVHVSVYSSKTLTASKAASAADRELRALGFTVWGVTVDPSSPRSAMVSAEVTRK